MAGAVALERAHWTGYRWSRHGFDGPADDDRLEDLLLLGIPAGPHGAAQRSLVQRTGQAGRTGIDTAISPEGPLVSLWSVRGAPHAHPIGRLDLVRAAHAVHEADDGGPAYAEAVAEVAAALRAVVTGPTPKARASAEVTTRVSASLVQWCQRCGADHVPDGLFRAAGCQAPVVLGDEERGTILHPEPRHAQQKPDRPRLRLLEAYFRVNGPTTAPLFGDWMQVGAAARRQVWNELADDLVRVQVDGRRYDLPEALLRDVQQAPEATGVVLVPPHDPYLRQVDRTLLVTDSTRRRQVWRALSAPGALLVDGEVAGTWRYRRSDRVLTVTAFDPLSRRRRAKALESAELVASATGEEPPKVSWE